jgi:YVTN family beta-propeller protein
VSRIDPRANLVAAVIGVGHGPGRLVCAFGSVWVLDDRDHRLWRIDPRTNRAASIRLRGRASGAPAVAGGALWVTVWDDATLVRVDPATNRARAVATTEHQPTGVLFARGSFWVASSNGGVGRITRIHPDGFRTTATILAGRLPWFQGTSAGDEAIWVADGYAGTVLRIDPATNRVVGVSRVGQVPVASVLPGTVWVNLAGSAVSRIDTVTNEVVESIRVGGSPGGIAVGYGSVWVAGYKDATVWRLDGRTPS